MKILAVSRLQNKNKKTYLPECLTAENLIKKRLIVVRYRRSETAHNYFKQEPGLFDSRSLRLPGFLDNRYMKMAMLSALLIGHLYPLGGISSTNIC
jgi:hypothetical protein